MSTRVAARVFGEVDQEVFARATGDVNPMHVDPVAARRTQAGACVVHGMHAGLWALEALATAGRVRSPIASLSFSFEKFIYVGSEVDLCVARDADTALRAELFVDGLKTTTVTIGFGPALEAAGPELDAGLIAGTSTPYAVDFADLAGRSGRLPTPDEVRAALLFPAAASLIGADRVEALAQLSTLVGMYCPGLHSIFSSARIRLLEEPARASGLTFAVQSVDDRFRMTELAVRGGGIVGSITAFVRHPPIVQPALADLAQLVGSHEFSEATALVIGGSRGLGALTAKAIAAGGGRAIVTYFAGNTEARDIAEEIGSDRCRVLRFDALEEPAAQLAGLDWTVNQMYYFATPAIFRQKAPGYSAARFAEFCNYYVNGFEATCTALFALGAQPLTVFYPSSVAVEERPKEMTEYSMAKASGEILCADLTRFVRGLRVIVRRLPRVLTDQTATVMPAESADPVREMLAVVREMMEPSNV